MALDTNKELLYFSNLSVYQISMVCECGGRGDHHGEDKILSAGGKKPLQAVLLPSGKEKKKI